MVYFKGKQTRLLETASYVDLILSYEQIVFVNTLFYNTFINVITQYTIAYYWKIENIWYVYIYKKKWNIAVYKNWDRCGSRSIKTL